MAEFTIWMRCIVEADTLAAAEEKLSEATEDVPAEMYFEEPPQLRRLTGPTEPPTREELFNDG